jgi:hypothetical protein
MDPGIHELLDRPPPISLDELNERAALQRRSDNTYLVPVDALGGLLDQLAGTHQILEIDGERLFEYESTYFDTASLDSFRDHARERRPRFKARTRCYVATGDCFFEVKVKREDGETVKRNIEYDPERRTRLEATARELIRDVLRECGVEEPGEPLEPSFVTRFERATVVAYDEPERTTFDFHVKVEGRGDGAVELAKRLAIVETKTPSGDGAWDRALGALGLEPVSLSKYRVGVGLLRDEDPGYARDVKRAFAAV